MFREIALVLRRVTSSQSILIKKHDVPSWLNSLSDGVTDAHQIYSHPV